jgi:hypothetical protein
MSTQILAPAAALVLWTLVMLLWVMVTRLPALKKAGINLAEPLPGGRRGQDLEGVIPDKVNWVSHNYAHLLEQPTLFYVVTVILAISGGASSTAITLAWAYVALRIVHSIVQATVNYVPVRFTLFLLGTIVLAILAVQALQAAL